MIGVFQMEEEMERLMQDRSMRTHQLLDKQSKEIGEFDLQTTTMGLDNMHIVQSTQETYQFEDLDTASVRGSVLSLTPSASATSFSTQQTSATNHGHASQTQL
jgi:hypothetical protein